MHKKNFFMVGMPGSGKTAYIGATWIMLVDGEVETKYKKLPDNMPEDYGRLDEIAQNILEYNDLERTKEGESIKLELPLSDERGNEIYLDIPDLAGEIFRDLVKDRRISKVIVKKLLEADCILFFTFYKNMSLERRIQLSENDAIQKEKKNEIQNVDINKSREANESEVVELLQLILELLKKEKKLVDIKFIMSAWDVVEEEYGTDILPEQFTQQKFPLLYQCIKSNQDQIRPEFWGISAIGGDLNNPEEVKRLQKEEINAIKVVMPDGRKSNDLTALLAEIGDEK